MEEEVVHLGAQPSELWNKLDVILYQILLNLFIDNHANEVSTMRFCLATR